MTVQIYSFKESITINLPPMLMVHECGGYFFCPAGASAPADLSLTGGPISLVFNTLDVLDK